MGKLYVFDHPLIQHKLSIMRRKETGSKEFRELLNEIGMLMAYEVTRDLPLEDVEIETPICKCTTKMLSGRKLGVVPILRAGLGMVDGILNLVPAAKVGHIGLYRDPETKKPVEYYCKLPVDAPERLLIIVDPMLATGGSSVAAIQFLKDRGCNNIRLMCLIGAPEGIKVVQEAHPDVDIYVAAVDDVGDVFAYFAHGYAGRRFDGDGCAGCGVGLHVRFIVLSTRCIRCCVRVRRRGRRRWFCFVRRPMRGFGCRWRVRRRSILQV